MEGLLVLKADVDAYVTENFLKGTKRLTGITHT